MNRSETILERIEKTNFTVSGNTENILSLIKSLKSLFREGSDYKFRDKDIDIKISILNKNIIDDFQTVVRKNKLSFFRER